MNSRLTMWCVLMLAVVVFLGYRVQAEAPLVSTDIFSLLPPDAQDPLIAEAIAKSRESFFRETLFLVAAPDRASLDRITGRLRSRLASLPWMKLDDVGGTSSELLGLYEKQRFQLLTEADRDALQHSPESHFKNSVLARLAMPGSASMFPLPVDPAGLLANFLFALPTAYPTMRPDALGYHRVVDGVHYRLVTSRLAEPEFDPRRQQELATLIEAFRQQLDVDCSACKLQWTGAIRFSAAARDAAESDIRLISSISLALITALFLVVFRRTAIIFQAMLPLVAGVLAGLAVGLAVFGQLNILALVFGTTLLGLTIDYVFHYLVHRSGADTGDAALKKILPGLSLGLVTSLVAFGFLLFSGFPAITQLAVFAMAGLIAAWLTVVAVLSRFGKGSSGDSSRIAEMTRSTSKLASSRKMLAVIVSGAVVVALFGVAGLEVSDDVRDLQATPHTLLESDRELREFTGRKPATGFLLIEGRTLEQRLAREERVFELAKIEGDGVSRFVPSAQRRRENIEAYAPLLESASDKSVASRVLFEVGFRPDIVSTYVAAWESGRQLDEEVRRAFQWLRDVSPVSLPVVNASGDVAHIARMGSVPAEEQYHVASEIDGVRYVEPLQRLESVFGEIRFRAGAAIALAYAMVLTLLVLRYRLIGAILTLMPSVIGGLMAIGTLGLLGLPLTVFSLMGCILVLGIGADYSLFLRESGEDSGKTGLAITLAAVTTLASFGLLALSSVPALTGFGVAIAAGICGAYLSAPLCNGSSAWSSR